MGENNGSHPAALPGDAVKDLLTAMLAGDNDAATTVVADCLQAGVPAAEVHWRLVQPALALIGAAWEADLLGVAEEHLATAVGEHALGAVYPALMRGRQELGQRLLLAAAEGERHVLGLRAIADVLEGAGYEVLNLGADAPADAVAEMAARLRPAAVGLSASLAEHVPALVHAATRLRALEIPVVAGGSAVASTLGHAPDILVARPGADPVAIFDGAIATAPRRAPAESSQDAARRAELQSGLTREAIAEQAAELARQEVDELRAKLRRLR